MCLMSRDLDVTFDLDSARMSSCVTFETYFSYQKALCIAVTDYYIIIMT